MDTSSSMEEGGRLEFAQQGLLSFLQDLRRGDRFALITSSDPRESTVPLDVVGKRRSDLSHEIRELYPAGEKPVYPAVEKALDTLRELDDPTRINAVVVLSGGPAGTDLERKQLLRKIAEETVTEGTGVRIFTVAYGTSADAEALEEIASKS